MSDSIESFINRKVVVLDENEPSSHAARAMRDNGVGIVFFANHQGHVTGLLTDRDLALRLVAESISTQTSVSQLMKKEVVSVSPDASIDEVVDLMKKNGIRRVPVLRQTEENRTRCVGLVSLDDLLAAKAISPDDVSAIVQAQVRRRAPAARPSKKAEQAALLQFLLLQKIQEDAAKHIVVSETMALEALRYILSSLVRRLHFTGGYSLISLLPQDLRSEFRDVSPGPDRHVDANAIVTGLASRLGVSDEIAGTIAKAVWASLKENLGADNLRQVLAQLPSDMRELLAPGESVSRRAGFEEWPQMDASFS